MKNIITVSKETLVAVLSSPMSVMTMAINEIKKQRDTLPVVTISNPIQLSFHGAAVMERATAHEAIMVKYALINEPLTDAEKLVIGIRCYIASTNKEDIDIDHSVLYGVFLPSDAEIVAEWAQDLIDEKTAYGYGVPMDDFVEDRELSEMRVIALLSRLKGGKDVPLICETCYTWLEL
jgi:hypothetical protein